jgi:hypothetical protein
VEVSRKALIAQPAAGPENDLVPCGLPAIVKIELNEHTKSYATIPAILALKKRHVSLLKAKRAIEAVIEATEHFVLVPRVESAAALRVELEQAGFLASVDMLDKASRPSASLRAQRSNPSFQRHRP